MKSVEIIEAEQVSASLGNDYISRAGVWAQTARALDDALWAARHRVDLLQKEQHADVERWNQANTEAQALIQTLEYALAESVKLQAHYGTLLNAHDGGQRRIFPTVEAWLARLQEIA